MRSEAAGTIAFVVLVAGAALAYAASKLHLPGPQSLTRVSRRRAAPPPEAVVRTEGGLGRFARERVGSPPKLS